MGIQCAKPMQSNFAKQQGRRCQTFESQMSQIKQVASFQIKINNLRLLNLARPFQNMIIQLKGAFHLLVPYKDFAFQDNIFISPRTYTCQFHSCIHLLANKYVEIFLEEKGGKSIEVLRIKVNQLFRGPVRHDHLLKQFKSRLLFDFHIDQYLHSDIILGNCEAQWNDEWHHHNHTYYLSLIFSNSRAPIESSKVFEKHEKIKEVNLQKMKLKSSQLKDAIIRVRVMDNISLETIFEYLLPIAKLLQLNGFKNVNNAQINYQLRQLNFEEVIYHEGNSIGILKFNTKFLKSRLFVQQMQCVILSEEGIVTHTLSELKTPKNHQLKLQTLIAFIRDLQNAKQHGISQYDFYRLLQEIIIVTMDKLFRITDELFATQDNLLDLLLQLAQFLELGKEIQNQYVWTIINYLCKDPILNLKYFCGIKRQKDKLIFSKKYYHFILLVLKKIIKLTQNGISFKELIHVHKFIAFSFFRLPWCQEQIVTILQRKGDPIISQEKLAEIGASYALKSPSKNYFYDWEGSVLRLVRKDEQFMRWMQELNEAKKQRFSWAKLLFDRDYEQLFYSIYSQLWDEAETFLNNNGKILWEYFPKYGQLLSIFFGEINNSKIMDFSPQMTKCNMKLIKNEKLLTTFMMLIFPKTHLFETYCVIKCLNLIECYFMVILNNHKKLPYNFHYNYFYAGIKCILESQHSYLLQKMLSIIYKFYFIFTQEFKQVINKFILSKVFYKLFLHWSEDVRSLFHMLLIFRIYEKQYQENPQLNFKKGKNISQVIQIKIKYEHIIESLKTQPPKSQTQKITTPVSNDFYTRMKKKLNLRSKERSDQKQLADVSENSQMSDIYARKRSYIETTPIPTKRKWSVSEQYRDEDFTASSEELKYLEISLKEYEQAKKQMKPDQKVEKRSKMFQEVEAKE